MSITPDVVRHIARLARLRFDEAESAELQRELAGMLAHFGQISAVPTEGVEPTAHVGPTSGAGEIPPALRDDVPRSDRDDATREALLRLSSSSSSPFFRVPRFQGSRGGSQP